MHTAKEKGERFVLFCENERLGRYFEMNSGVKVEKRYFFELAQQSPGVTALPQGFVIKPIDASILPRLDGRIKPSFSWESDESFLQKGVGFCAMYGDTPAAWAFSAAVSDREIDIVLKRVKASAAKDLLLRSQENWRLMCCRSAKSLCGRATAAISPRRKLPQGQALLRCASAGR